MRLRYYTRHVLQALKPAWLHGRRYAALMRLRAELDPAALEPRLAAYLGPGLAGGAGFELPADAVRSADFAPGRGKAYYMDLREFLHFFTGEARFAYKFGDDMTPCLVPTIAKMRSLVDPADHAVIFKLNRVRHFRFVRDTKAWRDKRDSAVWRGLVGRDWRRAFVRATHDHPLCDVGQTRPDEDVPWMKPRLSIAEQLAHKFVFSIEGNDVATNLKWVLSSNSLCVMPRPKVQSWFLEGALEPGVHYAEIAPDFSDVGAVLEHYLAHPGEAEAIIRNAHAHVARFRDPDLEELFSLLVLERYFAASGQAVRRFA